MSPHLPASSSRDKGGGRGVKAAWRVKASVVRAKTARAVAQRLDWGEMEGGG